jgi:hypothetical protein
VLAARSEEVVRFEAWSEIFPPHDNAYPFSPRVLNSPFVEKWRTRPEAVRQQAAQLRDELMSLVREHRLDKLLPFAGQTAGMIRDIRPADTIVKGIVAEAERALTAVARLAAV